MIKKRNLECLPNFNSDLLKRIPDIADIILKGVSKEERKGKSGRIVEKKDEENNFWKSEESKDWDHEILDLLRSVSDWSNDYQIMSLVNMLKGPQERIKKKNNLYRHIEECLKKNLPDCIVILYGSSSNGFAFQDSDLDVFVDVGPSLVGGRPREDAEEENDSRDKARTNLVAHTLRKEERFRSARAILNARTPIVKMRDSKTGIECDFNVISMGVHNSMLINYYRTLDTRCGYLISVVKYMATKQGIVGHGSGDHLNSYTIVLMAIFFLQVRDILPSVATLQRNVKAENKRGWNVAFDKDFKLSEWRAEAKTSESDQGEVTIFSLLKEFLEFYICFPFHTHIICPLLGSPVKKYNLKLGYNLPKVLEQAPHFGKKKVKLEVDKSPLVIQDPFELTRNISGRISDAHLSKFLLLTISMTI